MINRHIFVMFNSKCIKKSFDIKHIKVYIINKREICHYVINKTSFTFEKMNSYSIYNQSFMGH